MNQLLTPCVGRRRARGEGGQSLVETAATLPLLLGVAFNLINFSYFWFVVLAMSAAPRMGVEYASQGGSAMESGSAPGTTAVSNLVYENVTNAIKGATSSNVTVRVCTTAKGVNPVTGVALCDTFGPAVALSGPGADPDAPAWVLDRVDVVYTITPIISGKAFSVVLPATLQFHRQVSMRSLF
jgi:Flp pilus assembly protein TadG